MIRLALAMEGHAGQAVTLNEADWHYVAGVMRRNVGDAIEVLAQDGLVWRARITAQCQLLLEERVVGNAPPRRSITLYQALLKGDHFSDVVGRGTEAGIARFVPVVTERSIVREVSPNKAARWRTVAKEASEQSRREAVPTIEPGVRLADLRAPEGADAYVLDPRAPHERAWAEDTSRPVALVVGPEGGFTPGEYAFLYDKGFRPLSLGPRVYRAENAGAFAAVLFLQ
ncbi:MAG: 16S rRNA (uracil(1498)-N(3))-methyltransferase [Firmicutes bacterium]|nr:16S rRNA (uracil(1498)-N(3))-methyltransferase [Bacillota bacterium]